MTFFIGVMHYFGAEVVHIRINTDAMNNMSAQFANALLQLCSTHLFTNLTMIVGKTGPETVPYKWYHNFSLWQGRFTDN